MAHPSVACVVQMFDRENNLTFVQAAASFHNSKASLLPISTMLPNLRCTHSPTTCSPLVIYKGIKFRHRSVMC